MCQPFTGGLAELIEIKHQLKLTDAHTTAMDIMFSKSYWGGKNLASLLTEASEWNTGIKMKKIMDWSIKLWYRVFSPNFYSLPYPTQTKFDDFLDKFTMQHLTSEHKPFWIPQYQYQKSCFDKLKLNRTWGPDGFTAEFCKKCLKVIRKLGYIKCLRFFYHTGRALHLCLRTELLNFHKVSILQSYRQMLLNVSYKILMTL